MKRLDLGVYLALVVRMWRLVWPILRQALGWMFILLGLLGVVLPVLQGVLFLVIGIALVGRRNRLIRRSRVLLKRFLRRWAAVPGPLIGGLGRVALRAQRLCSRQIRHLEARYASWRERRAQQSSLPAAEDTGQDARYKGISERV